MLEDNNPDLHNDLFSDSPNSNPLNEKQRKNLARSHSNVILAGVCAGIAETYNFDVSVLRFITIISLLFGGWSIVAYLVAAFLLPVRRSIIEHTEEIIRKQRNENFKTVLSGICVVIGLHFALKEIGSGNYSHLFLLPLETMMPLFFIGAGILIIRKRTNCSLKICTPSLYQRTRNDRLILGVCGGLAKYLDIDLLSLRIIFIILTGLTLGLIAIIYLIIGFFTTFEPSTPGGENE
jgi:phage shock protein C